MESIIEQGKNSVCYKCYKSKEDWSRIYYHVNVSRVHPDYKESNNRTWHTEVIKDLVNII